ncbi:MAG: MFS transporter [Pseudonocardiaceae bacterium]
MVLAEPTFPTRRAPMARLAAATMVGTAVEYYDFYLYTSVAALIFGPLFFPQLSTAGGTIAAVATISAAFVARPVGAVLFGHYGDRFGRKVTLVASMVVMGSATVLVGLVPGYATAGLVAPLVLVVLRFGQGLGVGGEWAGAVLLATEHAPAHRRGWYSSYPITGVAIGFLLANGSLLALTALLPDAALRAWGWRVPFLASVVLIAIGVYVRVSLAETPVFQRLAARGGTVRVPVWEVVRYRCRTVLLAAGATVLGFAMVFLVTSYGLAYGASQLHLPMQTMICLAMLSYGMVALVVPTIGATSDRWGRRRICLIACGLAAGWAYPFVVLLGSAEPFLILVAFTIALAIGIVALVTMGAYLPELFDTRVRYTGAALTYNLAGLVGGGLVPIAATALSTDSGPPWPIAVVVVSLAAVGCVCLSFLPETAPITRQRADDWTERWNE